MARSSHASSPRGRDGEKTHQVVICHRGDPTEGGGWVDESTRTGNAQVDAGDLPIADPQDHPNHLGYRRITRTSDPVSVSAGSAPATETR
jgi:hypothetical protein